MVVLGTVLLSIALFQADNNFPIYVMLFVGGILYKVARIMIASPWPSKVKKNSDGSQPENPLDADGREDSENAFERFRDEVTR
jgi:hypothetical protein